MIRSNQIYPVNSTSPGRDEYLAVASARKAGEDAVERESQYITNLNYCSDVIPLPDRTYMRYRQCRLCDKLIRGSNR